MNRVVIVTGSASGIGRATAERFRKSGNRVIGVDLRDADVIADLGSVDGRAAMLREIEVLAPDGIDTVIAAAGVAHAGPRQIIAVNYFGALATLEGLRPLQAKSARPRAVAVLSTAAIPELCPMNDALVEACLNGDEVAALAAADAAEGAAAYSSSKYALSRWLRRAAVGPKWAGSGILLNGVAPGTVYTAMTAPLLATEEGRAVLAKATPIAVKEYGRPEELAEVLGFLGSLEGSYLVGQILFVDGGTHALTRPTLV
jgi:NAD(P)-dependent dehydrogenase (short-subunit alcohol dehydrogenase family)